MLGVWGELWRKGEMLQGEDRLLGVALGAGRGLQKLGVEGSGWR